MLEFFYQQFNVYLIEESEILFPVYKRQAPMSEHERNLTLEIYMAEHRRLLSLIQESVEKLREIYTSKLDPNVND